MFIVLHILNNATSPLQEDLKELYVDKSASGNVQVDVLLMNHGCLKRLFDFFDKMSYFTSQEVGNPAQIIKNVELLRVQAILQKPVTFVESLFT